MARTPAGMSIRKPILKPNPKLRTHVVRIQNSVAAIKTPIRLKNRKTGTKLDRKKRRKNVECQLTSNRIICGNVSRAVDNDKRNLYDRKQSGCRSTNKRGKGAPTDAISKKNSDEESFEQRMNSNTNLSEDCAFKGDAGFNLSTKHFPKSWTREMIRYYFEPDERYKNFDYVKLMEKIEYKESDWRISDADKSEKSQFRKSKDFFLRCAKCGQKGHVKKECRKEIVCYVCGGFKHSFSNCPNTLCFTCGRAAKKYSKNCRQCRQWLSNRTKCSLCGQIWHEEGMCPSKWRKYSMNKSDSAVRINSRKYCYNCAQQGHFGFECPRTLECDYPPENPLKTAFPNTADTDTDTNTNTGTRSGNDNVHVVFIAEKTSRNLCSEMGTYFLRTLSQNMNMRIEFFNGKRSYIKLFGDEEVVNYCKSELLKWGRE